MNETIGISIAVSSGGNRGLRRTFDAAQVEITFGRGELADVRLHAMDTSCSRGIHGRMICVDGDWHIQAEHENGIVIVDGGLESIVIAGERRNVSRHRQGQDGASLNIRLGKHGPKLEITLAPSLAPTDATAAAPAQVVTPLRQQDLSPLAADRSEQTIQWSGGRLESAPVASPLSLQALFEKNHEVVIGRAADCDFHLAHPTVSLHHAVLSKSGGQIFIRDLASLNGTFVKGARITQPTPLVSGDRFGIGPLLFLLEGDAIRTIDIATSLRMEARGLEQVVLAGRHQTKYILRDVNLVIEPSEFVALLGPSGCGKSTLMNCLNGRVRSSGGTVVANGVDFYENFDQFRQSLGYVPQKDIVHSQLTVYNALWYTARLRLPRDLSPREIEKRIEEVLTDMELKEHRDTLIAHLSGGQIKRVSLGVELLASPSMLFIDEATSGLDAGIETKMMQLFRKLADGGRSVVCITHNVDNVVEACHMVLILMAGRLIYFGPPAEAPPYFGVTRLGQIYNRLPEKSAELWEADFRASRYFAQYVSARQSALAAPAAPASAGLSTLTLRKPQPGGSVLEQGIEATSRLQASAPLEPATVMDTPSESPADSSDAGPIPALLSRFPKIKPTWSKIARSWFQLRVLTRRYLELTLRDSRSLRLLLLQAPIVALCILIGLGDKKYRREVPRLRKMNDSEHKALVIVQRISDALADPSQDPAARPKTHFTMKFGDRIQVVSTSSPSDAMQLLENAENSAKATPIDFHLLLRSGQQETELNKSDFLELMHALRGFRGTQLPQELLDENVIPDGKQYDPRYTYVLLNIMAIAVFWFGCNNSAKEIVKEHAIYSRERAVNLQVFPYLASKFIILSIFSALQTCLLMLIVYGVMTLLSTHAGARYQFPPPDYFLPTGRQFVVLTLLAAVGIAFGLALSASVTTPDRANALLPYALIPQIVFGGLIPISGKVVLFAALIISPVNWAFEALHRGETEMPTFHLLHISPAHPVWRACIGLTAQMIVLLIIASWLLKRKGGVGGMVRE